ncbi:MAG: DMT family transporter [Candidatus Aminicenantes bacterium]|nr:DMT family transporter [Candidatus Aminicenantes bacterium]
MFGRAFDGPGGLCYNRRNMNGLFASLVGLPKIGEILSLAAALIWALAVVLFRIVGDRVDPLGINFYKNALALVLFGASMAVFGESPSAPLPGTGAAVFVLSGVLGIALSDWLFLTALVRLGAELTAIVDCAYSPFVIGLSFLFLGERMSGLQTVGVVLIVAAVLMITQKKSDARLSRRDLVSGVGLGVLAMLLTAAGIVMVKPMLPKVSLLWACTARQVGGSAGTGLLLAFHPRRREILAPLRAGGGRGLLPLTAILGAYISPMFWTAGMTYTQASIASALNQLNTIFIFVLAAVILKEKVTPLKLAAVALAFGGAVLVSASF